MNFAMYYLLSKIISPGADYSGNQAPSHNTKEAFNIGLAKEKGVAKEQRVWQGQMGYGFSKGKRTKSGSNIEKYCQPVEKSIHSSPDHKLATVQL